MAHKVPLRLPVWKWWETTKTRIHGDGFIKAHVHTRNALDDAVELEELFRCSSGARTGGLHFDGVPILWIKGLLQLAPHPEGVLRVL